MAEEVGPKQGRGLGVRGAYAQDPQGWKRPWGLWEVGLRLKEQKGPRRAPHLWSRRVGTSPGSPAGFLGLSGWGKCPPLLSCSSGPRGPLPPVSPDLPSLRGSDPLWPPLLLPPQSPHILPAHLGVPPVSLSIRFPHQQLAGALAVRRR